MLITTYAIVNNIIVVNLSIDFILLLALYIYLAAFLYNWPILMMFWVLVNLNRHMNTGNNSALR